MNASALEATLVLTQLLAPFPVTQESVSRVDSAIKGIRAITSRLSLLSQEYIVKLSRLRQDELHHAMNCI